jgi:hypothetical protein
MTSVEYAARIFITGDSIKNNSKTGVFEKECRRRHRLLGKLRYFSENRSRFANLSKEKSYNQTTARLVNSTFPFYDERAVPKGFNFKMNMEEKGLSGLMNLGDTVHLINLPILT